MLEPGLYEQTISRELKGELESEKDELVSDLRKIDEAEAPKILAEYVAEVAEAALARISESGKDSLENQIQLANKMIGALDSSGDLVGDSHQLLSLVPKTVHEIRRRSERDILRPETPMAQSSLFTGARHEDRKSVV